MRILVAEDDARLLRAIARALEGEGYEVDATADGAECLFFAEQDVHDLIVLDIVMPGMSGLDIVAKLRADDRLVPVLFVTARDSIPDRVKGLALGADDYLVKPFALPELIARVEALLRRSTGIRSARHVAYGDLELDLLAHEATCAGESLNLTQKEFELLEFLIANKGRILTRAQLSNRLWDYDADISFGILDVHIHNLRKKLGACGHGRLIQTVRGVGYLIKAGEGE